jgi:hypothetical protein
MLCILCYASMLCSLCLGNAIYAFQSMPCSRCYPIYASQSMICDLCDAIYTLLYMPCSRCYPIYAFQSMLRNLCYAIPARHPMHASMPCILCYAIYALHMQSMRCDACYATRRAQESPGEPRRAKEILGKLKRKGEPNEARTDKDSPRKLQDSPGKPRKA